MRNISIAARPEDARCVATVLFALLFTLFAFCPRPASAQEISGGKLPTRWAKLVSAANVLPEYPRPQMARALWQNLNGLWDYALTESAAIAPPTAFDGKILVPFPYEAALSGVGKPSIPDRRLWYRRVFSVSSLSRARRQRTLLHFGAVNFEAEVRINGQMIGTHRGGYDAFDFDITNALRDGENELVVAVRNPLTSDTPDAQIVGKQRIHPVSVLYTASTGIWQTVWMETVPAAHIASLKIVPDGASLHVTVVGSAAAKGMSADVRVMEGKKTIAQGRGVVGSEIKLAIPNPHLWSPEDPYLYSLRVSLPNPGGGDAVDSYAALRKISRGKDAQGRTVMLLNDQPIFQVGALDQGYWPDGLYTAPTDDALKYDIEMAKKLGFNLLRKHAKVEPDRWYYWTDKLGILVWQDMPQAFGDNFTDATKAQWLTELRAMIATHENHPSIVMWTLFNEGWGQHDTAEITTLAHQLDPTRLINAASGGYNQPVDGKMSPYRLPTPAGIGDINDTHTYPDPTTEKSDPTRALACGEFGGVSYRVPGHLWSGGNFGYGAVLHDGWHLTERYRQLLGEGYGLHADWGASAVVYTQIVDVENETNGLMTYDREVLKPLPDFIAAANRGQFPPLPPAPVSHDLVPTSQDAPQTWSYTTDKPADDWAEEVFDATGWKTGGAPFGQGYHVNTDWHTDDIWLRRTITLPATIPPKLTVLAQHDEDVEVYLNGVLAASATGYNGDYVALPMSDAARAALKPGAANVIAVHCHQTIGGQVIDVGIVEDPTKQAASLAPPAPTNKPGRLSPSPASPFVLGADLSALKIDEDAGVVYKDNGTPDDCLQIFKRHGWNLVRLRLWVNPSGKNGIVNDLAYTAALAQRAKAAGMQVMLDLHYSDSWADAGNQTKPAAWKADTFDTPRKLYDDVEDYTSNMIYTLAHEYHITVDYLAIGNEITYGMLWPDGYLGAQKGTWSNWTNYATLVNKGIAGARHGAGKAGVPTPKTILHISLGMYWGVVDGFYSGLAGAKDIDGQPVTFDIIGLSFYPDKNTRLLEIRDSLAKCAAKFHKPIILCETAYQYRGDGTGMYPQTPEGQASFLADLIAAVKNTPNGQGVCYWEPEAVPNPIVRAFSEGSWRDSGWSALFDTETHEAKPGIARAGEAAHEN